jgi:hypothetical protein
MCVYVCMCVCEFPVDVKLMKMVEKQDQVISSLEKQVCNCVYAYEYFNYIHMYMHTHSDTYAHICKQDR